MTRGRKPILIPAAIEILKEYESRITIRQLFYRLVSKRIIQNTLNAYITLTKEMIAARRDGRIPYGAFEDRTRHFVEGEPANPTIESAEDIYEDAVETYENADEIALENFKTCSFEYELPFWYGQPKYVEVWVEKEALKGLFEPIAEKYGVTLFPCRGYASLTMLYETSLRLNNVQPDREIRILYFGDYDMRGLNIEENIQKSLLEDFGKHATVIRCALTKEQIETFQLPPAPAKKTDSMARGWIEKQGDVAWELDALDPHELEKIIEVAIKNQIDLNVLNERNEIVRQKRQWLATQVSEYLNEEAVEK